jgi:hypothetical protein
MIYRGPGTRLSCRLMIRLLAHPPSPLSRQQVVFLSQFSCVSPVELTGGRGDGVGEEPNYKATRKPGLL